MKDCFFLGYISRRVGNTGDVLMQMDVDNPTRYRNLESIFIELNKSLIPFFIKTIRINGNVATLSLDGISTIEKAEELTKAGVYLPLNALPALKGKKFYLHEIIGYSVIDKIYGSIGIVQEVLDFPQQRILQIKKGEREILLPIRDEFIELIDRAKKEMLTCAPEGLIDIYINPDSISNSEKESN